MQNFVFPMPARPKEGEHHLRNIKITRRPAAQLIVGEAAISNRELLTLGRRKDHQLATASSLDSEEIWEANIFNSQ